MSKGNSGLQSKHQAKVDYTSNGIIGEVNGYEVLKELIIKVRNSGVTNSHRVIVEGRMAIDDYYEEIGIVEGSVSKVFHIADFDYVRFSCLVYDTDNGASLRTSGFFNDGAFTVAAIDKMNNTLKEELTEINSNICKINEGMSIIKKQIELITDHEEYEVK